MPRLPKSRMNFNRGVYGVRKWQYEKLDYIDLLCEISIFFSSCSWPSVCRVCRKYLRWCLEILMNRWSYIQFIDFYDALEAVKNNRELFNSSIKYDSERVKQHI